MNIKQYGKLLAASVAIALSSSPVFASQCNQPSPLEIELGEDYWDVEIAIEKANLPKSDATKISATTENDKALAVLDMFDTRHYTTAYGTRHVCKGSRETSRIAVFESTLELDSRSWSTHEKTDEGLRLEFMETAESKKEKTGFNRYVIVDLPVATQWRVDSAKSISTTAINRRRNAIGASMYQHIDTELERTAQGIRLSQTLYVNGHRASWATWTLVK